jgi:hypothetical protein
MAKFYFTLGQCHTHSINGKTLDKDSVAVVEALDEDAARNMFFEWTEGEFHRQYTQEGFDKANRDGKFMKFFPRGLIQVN